MAIVGSFLIAAAALVHVVFFAMESVLWSAPGVWRQFGVGSQRQRPRDRREVALIAGISTERIAAIRKELQDEMDRNAQVFRTDESLAQVTETIHQLRERYRNVQVQDKGKRYNTDLLEAVELGFLLDLAEVVVYSARNRKESRGGHMRDDFPKRDDENYMKHTMAYLTGDPHSADAADHITLDWKPVVVTRYQPMERKY